MKIAARFSCVAVLTALVLGAPAALAARLTHADRVAINATLDTFVNHAVKRQDPGASYFAVTPANPDAIVRAPPSTQKRSRTLMLSPLPGGTPMVRPVFYIS